MILGIFHNMELSRVPIRHSIQLTGIVICGSFVCGLRDLIIMYSDRVYFKCYIVSAKPQ